MQVQFRPFFINTNLVLENEDIQTFDNLWSTIAGNTGNSYIGYSIIKIIYGHYKKVDQIQSIWNYDFSKTNEDTKFINENYTHVIFCMQDQLNTNKVFRNLPWNKMTKFIEKINIPFIPVSIGANCAYNDNKFCDLHKTLNKDLIRFIKTLASKSELMGVRGEMTLDVLNRLGIKNALPVGCPTFYEELNPNKQIIKKPFNKDFKILRNITTIFKPSGNEPIILQDEKNVIDSLYFNNVIRENCFKEAERFFIKNFFFNNNILTFTSIDRWKKYVSKFDFLVSSRVHGAVLALNSKNEGIPVFVSQGDIRAYEMTKLLNVPYCDFLNHNIDKKTVEELYELANFNNYNKSFKNNYNNFMNFLRKNGIPLDKTQDFESKYAQMPELNQLSKDEIFENIINKYNVLYCSQKNKVKKREFYIPVFKNRVLKHNIVLCNENEHYIGQKRSIKDVMPLYRKQIEKNLKIKMTTQTPIKYEDYLNYFYAVDLQSKINKLTQKYKNKPIIIYGAGIISKCIIENFDLSGLNIMGVCDRIFKEEENKKFFCYNSYSNKSLDEIDAKICFLFILKTKEVKKELKKNSIKLKCEEFIKIK